MEMEFKVQIDKKEAPYLEEYSKNSIDGVTDYRRIYFDSLTQIGEIEGESYVKWNGSGNKHYKIYLYRKGSEEGIAIQDIDSFHGKNGNADFEDVIVYLFPFTKLQLCIYYLLGLSENKEVNQ